VAGQRGEDAGTMAAYLDILEEPDFAEGFRAFKEKRAPRF
jgi:enoyl-CoA hydratase/carnithine racemase